MLVYHKYIFAGKIFAKDFHLIKIMTSNDSSLENDEDHAVSEILSKNDAERLFKEVYLFDYYSSIKIQSSPDSISFMDHLLTKTTSSTLVNCSMI